MVLAHNPGDALVVHPLLSRDAVVELGGDPRSAVRPVLGLDGADPVSERGVGRRAFRPPRSGALPGVERRAGDLHGLAQPLHLEGVSVVGDELEAAHQFVSPAKYFAADLRISRSVVSLVVSASSSRTRASSPASLAACDSTRPPSLRPAPGDGGGDAEVVAEDAVAVFVPLPRWRPSRPACLGRCPSRWRCPTASRHPWTRTDRRPADGSHRCSSCGPCSGSSRFPQPLLGSACL